MSRRLAWSIVLLGWIANTVLWAVVIPPFPGHYVVCLAASIYVGYMAGKLLRPRRAA